MEIRLLFTLRAYLQFRKSTGSNRCVDIQTRDYILVNWTSRPRTSASPRNQVDPVPFRLEGPIR